MKTIDWRYTTFGAAAVTVASIVLLWSWNILAELFGGPAADFRHVIAVLAIAFIARAFLTPARASQ